MPSDTMRHELVNGELKTISLAGFGHGITGTELAARLHQHVKSNKLGVVLNADTGFVLRRNPDTVRAPDVAFVKASRIPTGPQLAKFLEGPPDLAVEIVSPTDTVDALEEKVADYLAAGCLMVWVIHPKAKYITVHRPASQPLVLRESDHLDGQDVLPKFSCIVADLFT